MRWSPGGRGVYREVVELLGEWSGRLLGGKNGLGLGFCGVSDRIWSSVHIACAAANLPGLRRLSMLHLHVSTSGHSLVSAVDGSLVAPVAAIEQLQLQLESTQPS